MADRRVVHRKIVESDAFYALPEGAQSLYLHLTINADDDGFVNSAGSIVTRIKGGQAKLDILVKRRFLLKFGDIYVIKHWRVGNSLKNDRKKPPTYPDIAAKIWIKPNRSYTDHPVPDCETLLEVKTGIHLESGWNPFGIHLESQQKGTEQKGTDTNRTESPEGAFGCLWGRYPEHRKGSRSAAWEAFRMEITSQAEADEAADSLGQWLESEQWAKDGGQYVPYLANWLERGIWKTRPVKLSTPCGASGELGAAELEAIQRVLAQPDEELDYGY